MRDLVGARLAEGEDAAAAAVAALVVVVVDEDQRRAGREHAPALAEVDQVLERRVAVEALRQVAAVGELGDAAHRKVLGALDRLRRCPTKVQHPRR